MHDLAFKPKSAESSKLHGSKASDAQDVLSRAASFGSPTFAADQSTSILRKASCACGGGCPACQAKSNDLKVSQPNDPAEIEADQIADKVMRMPVGDGEPTAGIAPLENHANPTAIPRKCDACEEEDAATETVQRKETRAAAPAPPPVDTPRSIKNVIGSGGQPLDLETRGFFEPRFGADLSHIRTHTDSAAGQSARSINAKAYTLGSNIVFGSGEYRPMFDGGRRLIAHELAHTLQQRDGRVAPKIQREEIEGAAPIAETAPEEEGYADTLIHEAITEVSIQMAHSMQSVSPIPIPETVLAALVAAETGFLIRSYERLIERGEVWSILGRMRELLNPLVMAEYCARFMWGLIKGLVSPITGLVHLGIGAVQLLVGSIQWLYNLPTRIPALEAEAMALQLEMINFGVRASTMFASMQQRPNLLSFAGAIFDAARSASDAMEHHIVSAAQSQGRSAADSLVNHFLETPLPELAETAGEIIGTVIVELVILIFTDGIGNLITKLGEFARTIGPLARGVPTFINIAIRAGRIIAQVEHLIGVLLSRTILRPLMPLFEALEPLLARMRQFTQRLIGIGESGAGAVAGVVEETTSAATRVSERAGAGHPPPRPTPTRRTTPRVTEPTPAPAPEPRVTEPAPTPEPRIAEPAPAPAPEPRITEPAPERAPVESAPAPETRDVEPPPEPRATEPTPETAPEPDARARPEAAALDAEDLSRVGPLNEETLAYMREHPDQLHAWAEHPDAAELCKLCASECFPHMNRQQIERMEEIVDDLGSRDISLEDLGVDPADLTRRLKTSGEAKIEGILDDLEGRIRTGPEGVSSPSGLEGPEAPLSPREAEEAIADRAEARLTPREAWEPPAGARPRPSVAAPQTERLEWVHERLQMHVDGAIERYRIEGLTPSQEAALIDNPGLEAAFRGSRIDQFAKDTIMQDLELADAITAPDYIPEPDILISSIDQWFDITTRRAWQAHLEHYMERYGADARLLPTR